MEIKDWIRAARAHAGLTLEQMGELVGRTKSNVHGWERGLHEPNLSQIKAICTATRFPAPWQDASAWPLSQDLLAELRRCDPARLRQAENAARNILEMDPLPRLANELAA